MNENPPREPDRIEHFKIVLEGCQRRIEAPRRVQGKAIERTDDVGVSIPRAGWERARGRRDGALGTRAGDRGSFLMRHGSKPVRGSGRIAAGGSRPIGRHIRGVTRATASFIAACAAFRPRRTA